jgi:glucosyl-dolichyl phosphate glucuronosyltransferase
VALPIELACCTDHSMADKLAVVITSYSLDRRQDVCDALNGLADQHEPADEVLFVAEGPPELQQAIEAHAATIGLRGFRSLRNDGDQGLSAARNVATIGTDADFVAFLDDDTVPEPGWSAAVRAAFAADEGVIGVTGPVQPIWVGGSADSLPTVLYWLISCTDFAGWSSRREVRGVWGVNMAFRRRVFEMAGLFSLDAGYASGPRNEPWSEDLEFSLRARSATGGAIWFEPGMRVKHKVYPYRLSTRFISQRARLVGSSQRLARRLYPNLSHDRFEMLVGVRIGLMLLRSLFVNPLRPTTSIQRLRVGSIVLFHACLGFLWPGSVRTSGPTRR